MAVRGLDSHEPEDLSDAVLEARVAREARVGQHSGVEDQTGDGASAGSERQKGDTVQL